MNALDWTTITFVLISLVIGIVRGIIKEILKLINLGLAILSALYLKEYLVPILEFIKVQEIREIIASVLIFVFVFIAGSIIIFLICQMIHTQGFGKFVDKFLGMGYGFIRGLSAVILLVTMLEKNSTIITKDWWKKSLTVVEAKKLSKVVSKFIPVDWEKKINQL